MLLQFIVDRGKWLYRSLFIWPSLVMFAKQGHVERFEQQLNSYLKWGGKISDKTWWSGDTLAHIAQRYRHQGIIEFLSKKGFDLLSQTISKISTSYVENKVTTAISNKSQLKEQPNEDFPAEGVAVPINESSSAIAMPLKQENKLSSLWCFNLDADIKKEILKISWLDVWHLMKMRVVPKKERETENGKKQIGVNIDVVKNILQKIEFKLEDQERLLKIFKDIIKKEDKIAIITSLNYPESTPSILQKIGLSSEEIKQVHVGWDNEGDKNDLVKKIIEDYKQYFKSDNVYFVSGSEKICKAVEEWEIYNVIDLYIDRDKSLNTIEKLVHSNTLSLKQQTDYSPRGTNAAEKHDRNNGQEPKLLGDNLRSHNSSRRRNSEATLWPSGNTTFGIKDKSSRNLGSEDEDNHPVLPRR